MNGVAQIEEQGFKSAAPQQVSCSSKTQPSENDTNDRGDGELVE
jgi:hypothetical protein